MMIYAFGFGLAVAALPQFSAMIPVPPRPAEAKQDRFENFVPLGITADRAKLIARAGNDLVHWDIAANKEVSRWEKALPPIPEYGVINPSLAISDDGRWLGIANGRTWSLLNIADRKTVATFFTPDEDIRTLVVSPNGAVAVSASRQEVHVWDIASGRETSSYPAACYIASNEAFDEHILYDESSYEIIWLKPGGVVRQRVVLKDTPIANMSGNDPYRYLRPVRATPDGKELVYPGAESWITLDRETGAVLGKAGPSQEKGELDDLGKATAPSLWILDPSGKNAICYSWGHDAHVRVIDRKSGRVTARFVYGSWAERTFMAVSAAGDEVYMSCPGANGYEVIGTTDGQQRKSLTRVGKLLEAGMKAEPDRSFRDGVFIGETHFAVLDQAWRIKLYDTANPLRIRREATVPGKGEDHALALSPTGNTLALVRYGSLYERRTPAVPPTVHLWNVKTGHWQSIEVLPVPQLPKFTPTGDYVVVECEGLERSQVFVVIDVLTGQKVHVVRPPMNGYFHAGPTGELGWEQPYGSGPDFRHDLDCKRGEFRPATVVWPDRWGRCNVAAPDRRSGIHSQSERVGMNVQRFAGANTINAAEYTSHLVFSPDSRHFAAREETHLGDVVTDRYDMKALPGKFVAFSPTGDRIAVQTTTGIGILPTAAIRPMPAAGAITANQARDHWKLIRNYAKFEDYEAAFQALIASPGVAVETAKTELTPAKPFDDAGLRKQFQDLNDNSIDVRLTAFEALQKWDRRVHAKIAALQASDAPYEAKRLARKAAEAIPDGSPRHPADIHAVYVVEILERIGTPEALALLAQLSGGDPEASFTREAAMAHIRLKRLIEKRERR